MKKDNHGRPAGSRRPGARKRYSSPGLVQYGAVRDLVKTGGPKGSNDTPFTMTAGSN